MISGSADPEDHIVRLTRVSRGELPATDGRWRSFGCRVLVEHSPDADGPSDVELMQLAHDVVR